MSASDWATSVLVLSLTCVAYTYAGHPALLWVLARLRPRPWKQAPITPSIVVYVSAFNEEKAIAAKLEGLLAQEYAGELAIVVANDGSTDGTARIVRSLADPRIRLWDFERNRGKAAMQNEIVPQLACEIVVFTDSTSWLPRDAVAKIARHFADPRVGAVSTDVRFLRRSDHGVERGQGAYWRYERFLRTQGARAGTNVVCSGTCYAIRRTLFREIPLDVGEDLANPINVAFAGFRVVFDPETCVEEESSATHAAELRMRRRVALRNLTALVRYWRYLQPRFGFAAFQLAVHKYLRCLCWIPMTAAFVANALLAGQPGPGALFGAQCLGYGLALAGWLTERRGRSVRVLYVPYYFFLMNFSYALAALDYLRGVRRATWQTDR